MTNLVLQSFGRENEYKRALLTIFSYYAQTTLPFANTKVILFTDQPAYFSTYLQGLPVSYVLLTPEKIKDMRGEIDFLHRMKIALIEEAFSMIDGPMIYADSDTFFVADPSCVANKVSSHQASMHLKEYQFEKEVEDKTDTYRSFLKLINSRSFTLSDGKQISVTSNHASWNAGVMVFDQNHKKYIPDVYALTDQFYPTSGSHASEQYAFSIVLQENLSLISSDHVVYHYWYRIKKQIIDLFLAERLNDKWAKQALPEKLKQVKNWCRMLPPYLDKHLLTIQDRAIQAFNAGHFSIGWSFALKALLKNPFDKDFIRNILYHTKSKFFRSHI